MLGFAVLAVATVLFLLFINGDNSSTVEFLDKEMGDIIALEADRDGLIEDKEDFRKEHLHMIEDLNIGYTGYYSTLSDITLCSSLKELYIGATSAGDRFYKKSRDIPKPETKEKILQIQDELTQILRSCNTLEVLYIWNEKGTCELDNLDFLKYGENLKLLWLNEQKAIDYSSIYNCKELTVLYLCGCDISDLKGIEALQGLQSLSLHNTNVAVADEIIKLPNLTTLEISGTPLAENKEELARIYEAFPDIKVVIEE